LNDTVPEATTADEKSMPPAEKKDSKGSALWREIKGLLWVLLAVLAFHSLIAKPFYIPSESMMPGLLTGDRLVVTKYPYGWSWVSPSFHVIGPMKGRLFGRMPERGDIVIVTPPGTRTDYIKRVIGLPGDTLRMVDGLLYINGQPVKRQTLAPDMIPVDANSPCGSDHDPALYDFRVRGSDGKTYCRVPVVRETLPNGRSYETVELGRSSEDNFGPVTIPAGHVGRQPSPRMAGRSRRPRSMGKYRRPRRVHHLLARRHVGMVEPLELV
jgi:signal peptidase I